MLRECGGLHRFRYVVEDRNEADSFETIGARQTAQLDERWEEVEQFDKR